MDQSYQTPIVSLEQYTHHFFSALLSFMSMLMIYNIFIGLHVFTHLLTPDAEYEFMQSIIFILFAYPFIGANLCFIEIQRMNELLHDTDITLHLHEEEIGANELNHLKVNRRTESGNLLSSNSSFWYIFGFVLNHYPILYFMTKVAAFVAFTSGTIATMLGLDDDDGAINVRAGMYWRTRRCSYQLGSWCLGAMIWK